MDAKNVDFLQDKGKSEFIVNDRNGNIMPGNSNAGHKYGTGLNNDDKWTLVEYMKSL